MYYDLVGSEVPCDINGCDNRGFWVDCETLDHLQCIDLICFKCGNRRCVSREKYNSMLNIENFLLEQWMNYGAGWHDKVLSERKEREN